MRKIRIDIHDPENNIIVRKRKKKNISVVNNVFSKWKPKRQKSDVNIYNNSGGVICWDGFSNKGEPVWVVRNTYQGSTFTVLWTGNRPNGCPRWFLNEDNVKVIVDFKNQTDNEVIFLNILWKNLQIFQNHILLAFVVEQVEFLLVSQSLVLDFEHVHGSIGALGLEEAWAYDFFWRLSFFLKYFEILLTSLGVFAGMDGERGEM